MTYFELGRHDEALSDINRAIELDDKSIELYNARAMTYFELGHHDEALSDIRVG